MPKLQHCKNRWSITIPVELIKKKKWKPGKELVWSFDQDGDIKLMEI